MRMYALEVAVGDSRKSNASTTNLTALNHFSKKKKQVIIMLISVCLRKWKGIKPTKMVRLLMSHCHD